MVAPPLFFSSSLTHNLHLNLDLVHLENPLVSCLFMPFFSLFCFIREPVRKRVLEKRGEDFKKEGKIYRLRTQDDGEDENNTWNGNSTQQMQCDKYNMCKNHCFSYDLIQLKFCWRSGTALCVPAHLQSVSLFLLSGLKLFNSDKRSDNWLLGPCIW